MTEIRLSPSLTLPAAIFAQHMAVLGKTRSGKSSVLRLFVESLLDGNQRVCVIDPKGDWHGLRASADGRKAGYSVVIFGGNHADLPLSEHAGKSVAELVATGNRPCVIDLGGWMVGQRTRFFIDFASTLFRAIDSTLHLIIDEVHNFAPQGKILDPDAGKMLHWANRLGSEGAGKGLVIFSASQRPQKVHKDFLTCAETLVAMRVIHKLDRDAVKDWIDGAGDPAKGKEVLNTLASMSRGEGWVWSPEAQYGPQRVQFPLFKTYDSFAAPTAGRSKSPLKGWADVDLRDIEAKMAATIEEAKANDPAELRRQIAELKRQLAAKPAAAAAADPSAIERAKSQAASERDREWRPRLDAAQKVTATLARRIEKIAELAHVNGELKPIEPPAAKAQTGKQGAGSVALPGLRTFVAVPAPRSVPAKPHSAPISGITSRQQKFLDAAASLTTLGAEVTRETVAAWLGVHPRGGSVGQELSALVDAGMIEIDRGRITVTESGIAAAGDVDPTQAIQRAKSGLSSRQAKFFEVICEAYPDGVTRETIAERFNIHPRGGSLGEDLSRLAGRGLVERERGTYRARDFLFAGR